MKLCGFESAYAPVWNDVAASISSFVWSHNSVVAELPSFIDASHRLHRLHISAGDAGSIYRPLSLATAGHVEWVYISGDTVLVEVPRRRDWDFIGIVAKGRVGVRFECVASFTSRLPEFMLDFNSMQGLDILQLAEMARYAGSAGYGSSVVFRRLHDFMLMVAYPSCKPPRLAQVDEGFCACGACRNCLFEARHIRH